MFIILDAQSNSCGTIVNLVRDDTMNLVVYGPQMQPEVIVYQGVKVLGIQNLASIILGGFALGSMLGPLDALQTQCLETEI